MEVLQEVVASIDLEQIRKESFGLYGISMGLDTQLSLKKASVLYGGEEDELFQSYVDSLKLAHDKFLGYIFAGSIFLKMEQNPLHSVDVTYGVPNFYLTLLDELLEGQ